MENSWLLEMVQWKEQKEMRRKIIRFVRRR